MTEEHEEGQAAELVEDDDAERGVGENGSSESGESRPSKAANRDESVLVELEALLDSDEAPIAVDSSGPVLHSVPLTKKGRRRRGKRTVPAEETARREFTQGERVLILYTWLSSNLDATVFASVIGVSTSTLFNWRRQFEEHGLKGLETGTRGGKPGSRLPPAIQDAILKMKRAHTDWGVDRIRDMLLRHEGLKASSGAILRVLKENGFVVTEKLTRAHKAKGPQRFERSSANQMWQSDIFTFTLKRSNRKAYLVVFLDDYSRFVTGFTLGASCKKETTCALFEDAVATYGLPKEVLTDRGPQYFSWHQNHRNHLRGKLLGRSPHTSHKKSNASGGPCGTSASRRRCSGTSRTPGVASGSRSAGTTSTGRTEGSTV